MPHTLDFFLSVAGGDKYSSSSMMSLLCMLGRIIGTFGVLLTVIFLSLDIYGQHPWKYKVVKTEGCYLRLVQAMK